MDIVNTTSTTNGRVEIERNDSAIVFGQISAVSHDHKPQQRTCLKMVVQFCISPGSAMHVFDPSNFRFYMMASSAIYKLAFSIVILLIVVVINAQTSDVSKSNSNFPLSDSYFYRATDAIQKSRFRFALSMLKVCAVICI